jgi:hypothetical protein
VPHDAALSRRPVLLCSVILFVTFVGPVGAQDGSGGTFEQQMERAKRALAVGLDERAKRSAPKEAPAPATEGDVNVTGANPASPPVQAAERISAHWWIILGSYPEGASGLDEDSRRVTTAAGRCGVHPDARSFVPL